MALKRIIVTGASSFLGIRLVKKLLAIRHSVIAVVRRKSTGLNLLGAHPNLQIIELNLSEYYRLSEVISAPIDLFFALAWNGTRGEDRDNYALQQSNYDYSIAAVHAAIQMGCKKIITAGSQAEYGLYNQKISETTEEKPVTQYGKFKLKFYRASLDLCNRAGVTLVEPRFFSVYGPGDFEDTLVISTLRQMLVNKPCNFTPGIQMWDFLFVDDAIDAVLCLAESTCEEGVYNLGSGIAKPLKEYIYEMRELTSSRSSLNFGAIPYSKAGMVSIEPDISKIVEKTGWMPKVSFEKGIKQIIETMSHEDH